MHRQREWDTVATLDGPGTPGDEAQLVVLPDGRLLVEDGASLFDAAVLSRAFRLEPPFRARAVRQEHRWSVAAKRIEVVELPADAAGDEIELAWDGSERTVRVDGEPTFRGVPELERLAAERYDAYVVTAQRLNGRFWEVAVSAL
jgi:hypothetical protein